MAAGVDRSAFGSGKIELLLPEKAAFHLEATAERGDAVNDFGAPIEKHTEGRLPIVMVKDVDQKQNGQCRSNRFGSPWPFTLATHILILLSFKSFGGLGAFGGMGGCGPPSPGVSGSTSLGWVLPCAPRSIRDWPSA